MRQHRHQGGRGTNGHPQEQQQCILYHDLSKNRAATEAQCQKHGQFATLLERHGDVDNAQTLLELLTARDPDDKELDHGLASLMQRTGNADRLIERYLSRSEDAAREGRRRDAITWLREVLSIDRSRRDVARMLSAMESRPGGSYMGK